MPTSHVDVLVYVQAAVLLIQLHARSLRKAIEGSPSAWAAATHVGDQEKTPGSWLQPGPELAAVAILEVS